MSSTMNVQLNDKGQLVDVATGKVVGKQTKAKVEREVRENYVTIKYSLVLKNGQEYPSFVTEKGTNKAMCFPSVEVARQKAELLSETWVSKGIVSDIDHIELVVGNPDDGVPVAFTEPTITPATAEVRGDNGEVEIEAKAASITCAWKFSDGVKKSAARKKLSASLNNI